MSSDGIKLLGFTLAAVIAVAGAYVPPDSKQALGTLSGMLLGWLALRRPNDEPKP